MTAKNDDYFHLGLTDQEVLQSREKYGANLLTPPKRPSLLKLYLEKFEDPVVRVLLIAAVFSLIISAFNFCKSFPLRFIISYNWDSNSRFSTN